MGLFLCIFDQDDEIEGMEAGSYKDFNIFRNYVSAELENNKPGSKYPVLIQHSDCDGSWSPQECALLEKELVSILAEFEKRPAVPFHEEWQRNVAKRIGFSPSNLGESFIDVDGEPLLMRLIALAQIAQRIQKPILFQ